MKKTTVTVILSFSISLLAATVRADDGMTDSTNAPTDMPITSQQFVYEAARANMKEISLSKLALENSTNEYIKHFAHHMIHDHTAANNQLMKIAEKEGLNCPSTNDMYGTTNGNPANVSANYPETSPETEPPNENIKGAELLMNPPESASNDLRAIQSLQALTGPEFDRAYVQIMYSDHVKAINLFQDAEANLSDKHLKKFAEHTLPTLRKHYRMVRKLEDKMGMKNSDSDDTSRLNSISSPTTAAIS